jgi:hypothetical protein
MMFDRAAEKEMASYQQKGREIPPFLREIRERTFFRKTISQ